MNRHFLLCSPRIILSLLPLAFAAWQVTDEPNKHAEVFIQPDGSVKSSPIQLSGLVKSVRVSLKDPTDVYVGCKRITTSCGCNPIDVHSLVKRGDCLAEFDIPIGTKNDAYKKVDLIAEFETKQGDSLPSGISLDIIKGCPVLPPCSIEHDFPSKALKLIFENKGTEQWDSLMLTLADRSCIEAACTSKSQWVASIPWEHLPENWNSINLLAHAITERGRKIDTELHFAIPSRQPFRWVTTSGPVAIQGERGTVVAILTSNAEIVSPPEIRFMFSTEAARGVISSVKAHGSVCVYKIEVDWPVEASNCELDMQVSLKDYPGESIRFQLKR